MRCGLGLSRCCRTGRRGAVGVGVITGWSWRGSAGGRGPGRPGSWSGRSRWIRPSPGPINMLPGPARTPQGAWSSYKNLAPEPDDHGLGHSRGGWTTKAHVAVDLHGRPLSVLITAGQSGDNPQLLPVLDAISVPARGGRGGRPRSRPDRVVADKAYSHPSTRIALAARGVKVTIPERRDQIDRRTAKGSAGGRPPAEPLAVRRSI